ncbi:MAG: hypothetical protein VB047_06700 [Anaerotignum propionicum]|uniref:hypothetical protein n=1 Tax=Anaerotignum propionicum TaxID=28446 RepID=UPI002B213E6C|nr:hypothetical protein [Anaerotignum propionicum]MEA5057230.1 hypothetical protein [Anaerotignum propionicum]
MSKGSKQKYKQFTISSVEEGMVVLGSLISMTIISLNKYNEYFKEIETLKDRYMGLQEQTKEEIYIPSKEYDDINDKLLYRQRELLTAIADEQSASFSYKNLRKLLIKKELIDRKLSTQVDGLLDEFLDLRNWSFHNPQSLLVATKETANKRLPKELEGFLEIKPQLNPLAIDKVTHYDLLMLLSLVLHVSRRSEEFSLILENMKADYAEMNQKIEPPMMMIINGEMTPDVRYIEVPRINRLCGMRGDITQISMAIQKSKYDGSDKSFNDWVINKNYSEEN